jgi:membrane peptidoglycan carboxypeptidase
VTMVQNTTFDETSTAGAGATSVNYNTDHAFGNSQGFQTGSSFKPFTLAAWLEAGHTLNETVTTTQHALPFSLFTDTCSGLGNDVWNVSNADPAPPSMSVMSATAQSVNTAFADMGTKLDLCGIADAAFGMGIHPAEGTRATNFHIVPSMILGTNYISPLTMATAYAGIANNGVVCTPIAIDRITDASGKAIPPTKTSCSQGMPSDVAAGLAYALQPVLKAGGTGALANPGDGVPILAKTGTTDAAVQNWLVTSTTKIAQATWVGNVQGSVGFYHAYVNGVYGYNLKFLMDKTILQALDQAYGGDAFPLPPASMIGAVKPPAAKPARGTTTSTPTTAPGTTVGGTGNGNNSGNGKNTGNGNNKGGAPAKP